MNFYKKLKLAQINPEDIKYSNYEISDWSKYADYGYLTP